MESEEKPDLEVKPEISETADQKVPRWKANKEIEEMALQVVGEILPTEMRASDATLEEFYHHGFMLYKFGRYKEALSYFNMLMLANPQHPKYLMAAAACNHMQKDYLSAISLYGMTCFFEPDNPYPLYHMADCYIKTFHPLNAVISLEMAIEKCKEPKHQALKDRMTMMVDRLGKELEHKMKQSSESFFDKSRKMVLMDDHVFEED